jgi:hypothetical protein
MMALRRRKVDEKPSPDFTVASLSCEVLLNLETLFDPFEGDIP